MPKFFVSPEAISATEIVITGSDAGHLTRVLRKSVGDPIVVCDGCGFDYDTVIRSVTAQEVILEITDRQKNLCEPSVQVTLFQCVPKGSKMEEVVQKCVELGVSRIVPFTNARSVVRDDERGFAKKQLRWQRIADEAVKQCMRGRIPSVEQVRSFDEMLLCAEQLPLCLIPYEECQSPGLRELLEQAPPVSEVGIIIGSEGGFEAEEVARAQERGILPVTLGKRILRTETAGAAVLGCVMYRFDQMK